MGLRDDIQLAQQEALRAKDAVRLGVLRLLWSAIRTEEINERRELAEGDIVALVRRHIKQLLDAREDFVRGNRSDLISKTDAEVVLLRQYLPPELEESALQAIVSRVIQESGAKSSADVGRVMGAVMKEVQGKADGNRVRAMVSNLLES